MTKPLQLILVTPIFALLIFLTIFSAVGFSADPPEKPARTTEKEPDSDEDQDLEVTLFVEDYSELLEELEFAIDEFEEFFRDFGYKGLTDTEKKLRRLRHSVDEEYSFEGGTALMSDLEKALADIAQIREELQSNSSTSTGRMQWRRLRTLEYDLEDIRKQMGGLLEEARGKGQEDDQDLAIAITKASRYAEREFRRIAREMQEGQNLKIGIKTRPLLPESSAVPLEPSVPAGRQKTDELSGLSPSSIEDPPPSEKGFSFNSFQTRSEMATVADDKTVIIINNDIGGVKVTTGLGNEVTARLMIAYADYAKRAISFAREVTLDISSPAKKNVKDQEMVVAVNHPDDEGRVSSVVSCLLEVEMPRLNRLRIYNAYGPVSVNGLNNSASIHSSFSPIKVNDIRGDLTVMNTNGQVFAADVEGRVDITNSFAPIEIDRVAGEIQIANSYAATTVRESSGNLTIRSSGPVNVSRFTGNAEIRSGNGEMKLYDITGNLEAVNSFGPIYIENVGGLAIVENSSGPVEIADVGGPLSVTNRFAEISVERAQSDVEIESSNGQVSVDQASGKVSVSGLSGRVAISDVKGSVEVDNSNGEVSVARVGGDVSVVNQGAGIILASIDGAVDVENQNANVDLTEIRGPLAVMTTMGLVTGSNLSGVFNIDNNNGSVELTSLTGIEKDSRITTTYGEIRLELPKKTKFNLDARTTGGKIHTDFPIQVYKDGIYTAGEIISGNSLPTLTLRGENTSIRIVAY